MNAETRISPAFLTGSIWGSKDYDFQPPDEYKVFEVSGERLPFLSWAKRIKDGIFDREGMTQRKPERLGYDDIEADIEIDLASIEARIDYGKSSQIKGRVILVGEESVGIDSMTETAKESVSETTNKMSRVQYVMDIGVLGEEIEGLFGKGKEEDFEDGMISDFSKRLYLLIEKYSENAVIEISHIIRNNKADEEVAYEALKWIGEIVHPQTYKHRLWLLQKCLSNSSLYIRDAAALGLADMNDKKSIPALERAINREKNSELKKDMVEVLLQLKE